MNVQQNYSLKWLNTFGLDVEAEYFTTVDSVEELKAAVQWARERDLSIFVLGGGSNILLTQPIAGLTISNDIKGIAINDMGDEEVLMTIGAGEVWHQVVLYAIEQGLGGIENLSLIPGSTGAAPIQNIGAYGVELKDTFHSLQAFSLKDEGLHTFYKQDCTFGYRDSYFKRGGKNRYIITAVTLQLSRKPKINTSYGSLQKKLNEMGIDKPTIKDVSRAVIDIRQQKLPNPEDIGNAGSFFKNPTVTPEKFQSLKAEHPDIPHYPTETEEVKIPAAWLIDQLGWKGKQVGQAASHQHQPLVLVNKGEATGKDILQLAEKIQADVEQHFGIKLQPEVNIL